MGISVRRRDAHSLVFRFRLTIYVVAAFGSWSAWCLGMALIPSVFAEPYLRAVVRILVLAVPAYLWNKREVRLANRSPCPSAVAGFRGLLWGVGAAFVFLVPSVAYELRSGGSFVVPSHGAVWLNFIVGSPIAEEVFFRSLLFARYRDSRGPWFATVLGSCLFALFHLPAWWVGGDPLLPAAKLVTMLAYGFAFAGLYHFSRSIYAPIAAHILNNLVSLSICRAWAGT